MITLTNPREVTCPECKRVLVVSDRDANTIYVETIGALPDPCCQRAATDGHKKAGMFNMVPRGSA